MEYCDFSGYAKCKKSSVKNICKYETPYKPLTPKQKKILKRKLNNRTITRSEYAHLNWDRRFKNRRNRGVKRFWSKEKKKLITGESRTRSWSDTQIEDIKSGKTPTYNGEPIEGHHKYNALDYPQLADDPDNIYPVTNAEYFERWHGGNWQNDTNGVPNNINFEEEF